MQQYVEGLACSAVFIAARGRAALVGITRQLIGASWLGTGGFRYCGSIGPLELPPLERQTARRIGEVLAARFDLVGLFGVDAVINAEGVWPIEVNPRYTASVEILERAFELQLVESHVRACRDGEWIAPSPRRSHRQYGKAILFAGQDVTIANDWPPSMTASSATGWPQLSDIPSAGSSIETGWPVLTLFADGADDQQVLARLQAEAARLASAIGCHASRQDDASSAARGEPRA